MLSQSNVELHTSGAKTGQDEEYVIQVHSDPIYVTRDRIAVLKQDPLLNDLPCELLKFAVEPTGTLEEFFTPKSNAVLCLITPLLNFYACCKMHLIQEGDIGLVWYGDEPQIIGPGRHFLLAPTKRFVGMRCLTDDRHIRHGTIHIVFVRMGEIGIGFDCATGLPMLLTSGQHIINSPTFQFNRFSTLTKEKTPIGELSLIRVEIGDIGYGYRSNGELMILEPGLHLISPPDRYEGKLSMQLNIVQLPKGINESKDYVRIQVEAAVYYKIQNPYKALTEIGGHLVRDQVKELGIATLQQIIRSSTLVDIAGSQKVSYAEHEQKQGEPDFYARVHDQFLGQLHDHVLEEWGVEISNIRIESLRIHDPQLAQSIAKSAIQVSELEAEHLMLDKRTQIITVRATNKKKEIEIEVDAAADKMRRLAQAEADAMLIKARADKDAKVLQGEGEAEYSRLVQESGLGAELATLKIHQEALKNVEQIIYVPHLPKLMGESNPLMETSMLMPTRKK